MSNRIGSNSFSGQAPAPPQRANNSNSRVQPRGNSEAVHSAQRVRFSYESQESAALQVETAEGDTVNISLAAFERLQADPRGATAESGVSVQVEVDGNLNDQEADDISQLLQSLVSSARYTDSPSETQEPAPDAGYESLDSFQFAYLAYSRASLQLNG